jgi:hypothetical protein
VTRSRTVHVVASCYNASQLFLFDAFVTPSPLWPPQQISVSIACVRVCVYMVSLGETLGTLYIIGVG